MTEEGGMKGRRHPRPGRKTTNVDFEENLFLEFKELARANGRDFRHELEHAMKRHLAQPPVVRLVIDEEPLVDDALEEETPEPEQPKRPVGRPRKERSEEPEQPKRPRGRPRKNAD